MRKHSAWQDQSCHTCLYCDRCPCADEAETCADYAPSEDDAEEELLSEGIERERESFYRQWAVYSEEYSDH